VAGTKFSDLLALRRQEFVQFPTYGVQFFLPFFPFPMDQWVAVGMAITGHPPHRSGRALLTHPAPILGIWRRTAVQDKDELFVGLAAIS
jgi:hypothetical protein